jgi:hypothetical protein
MVGLEHLAQTAGPEPSRTGPLPAARFHPFRLPPLRTPCPSAPHTAAWPFHSHRRRPDRTNSELFGLIRSYSELGKHWGE